MACRVPTTSHDPHLLGVLDGYEETKVTAALAVFGMTPGLCFVELSSIMGRQLVLTGGGATIPRRATRVG